jgi:orotidine 5'-phosphate decarboxylase subfamily 2
MTFREKLRAASSRNDSLLCVGLDPQPALMPIKDVERFCRTIIEATQDLVCLYKPQSAFFEAYGREGWDALKATIEAVPDEIPVLLDAKRGDIGSTAEAYASAGFDYFGADAMTVNPYLGADSVAPFLARPDRTAFVLCRTSNPSAPDMQDLSTTRDGQGDAQPLYMRVADLANEWNQPHGNVGLVVGATYPDELARIRERCPDPAAGDRRAGWRPGGLRCSWPGRGRRRADAERIALGDLRVGWRGLRTGRPRRRAGTARGDQRGPPRAGC